MPRLREIPTLALILLAVIFVAGAGIRVYETTKPVARLSADALSYSGIGKTLGNTGSYPGGVSKLRWPPGTPLLFAVSYKLAPGEHTAPHSYGPPRWAQFLVSTGTILSVFLLGWLLAGPWAGVIAAAFIAFYPPLYWGPSNLLSEPFGAFLITSAFAALTAAWRSRSQWWFAGAGAIFGLVLLTRTDLLFVPAVMGLLVLAMVWRWSGWRRGLLTAALFGGALLVVIAPWTIYASNTAGRLVPITAGGGSAFFVGTYLPGNGSTYGLKLHLRPEIIKRYPQYRNTNYKLIPGKIALNTVAARHPDMSRDNALLTEARSNLKDAVLHHPGQLAGLWWEKIKKMWFRASLGGAHHPMPVLRTYHLIVVILAMLGLLAGLIRRRDIGLAAIAAGLFTSTAVHMLAVAHGRYALPLIPILFAGGVAGWWMVVTDVRAARRAPPAAVGEAPEADATDPPPEAPPAGPPVVAAE